MVTRVPLLSLVSSLALVGACGGSTSSSAGDPTPQWIADSTLLTDASAGYPGQAIADIAAVQLADGRWRLLFLAGGQIRRAISPDGLSLTMEPGVPLDGPTLGLGSNARVASVKLSRLDDGRVRAYFSSLSGMYSAISTDDGVTFAPEGGVRLPASAFGAAGLMGGSVVRTRDGKWRMYFSESSVAGPALTPSHTWSAWSTDLVTWTPDDGVRVGPGATVTGSAEHPCAIVNADGSVSIFYFRNTPPGLIYTATSADGLTFSSETSTGIHGNDPLVVNAGGTLRMYYNWGDDSGGYIASARWAVQ